MSARILSEIRTAIRHLNPNSVRELAARRIDIGLMAASTERAAAMREFFAPPAVSRQKRLELLGMLHRAGEPGAPPHFDITVCDEELQGGQNTIYFSFANPDRAVREMLRRHEKLAVPLASRFAPFRKPAIDNIIREVSRGNAWFALMAALPDMVPGLGALLWAPVEFASDTAFMTGNQIRMAFLIAAASDKPVGYFEQKAQIGSIIASAFGWRALARELIGKVPLGGGLIPKAAIAYAGTQVVGRSLERYNRIGYGLTREEQEAAYREAFERGKIIAKSLWKRARPPAVPEKAVSDS